MNWLDPLSGAILAGAIIPPLILLYFLKLRRRTQPIACTMLWKRSVEDLRANAPFQKLRKSLLLLLQLLALMMLILAIMQPQLRAGTRDGGRVILLIDNSGSMNATDVEGVGTRLDEAKEKAANLIETLQSSGLFGGTADEVMVISFNIRAEVLCNFTDSRTQLLRAIESIQPTDTITNIDEALKLARAHSVVVDPDNPGNIVTGIPATLELFSDGRIHDFADQVQKGESMNFYPIGNEDADNIAFANVAAERPFDQPGSIQVFASLTNYNIEDVVCRIQLAVDGNVAAGWIKDVPIDAATIDESTKQLIPGRSNVIFGPFPHPHNAVMEIANLREDDLMADNIAWLITPAPQNLRVAIVEPEISLITDAFAGMSMLRSQEVLSGSEFESMTENGGLSNYDVIVLDNFNPKTLPPGRYLSLGAELPLPEFEYEGESGFIQIADWNREHALLQYMIIDNLRIGKLQLLKDVSKFSVLAEAAEGTLTAPAIVEYSDKTHHIVHLTFRLIDTDWFWKTSFVLFMVNAVEYLGTLGEAIAERTLTPGDPISTTLPSAATAIKLVTPDGVEHGIEKPETNIVTWTKTENAGLYSFNWADDGSSASTSKAYAVNMMSEAESLIKPETELKWGGEKLAGDGKSAGLQTPLWPWAIALCLLVLMLEWWVYHRKSHV